MLELDKNTFEDEVLKSANLTIVDYWSPKCTQCLALMPFIEKLSEKYAGKVKFCKVETIGNREVAIKQRVIGLPTIIFYKDGQKVCSFIKDIDVDVLEQKINELIIDE